MTHTHTPTCPATPHPWNHTRLTQTRSSDAAPGRSALQWAFRGLICSAPNSHVISECDTPLERNCFRYYGPNTFVESRIAFVCFVIHDLFGSRVLWYASFLCFESLNILSSFAQIIWTTLCLLLRRMAPSWSIRVTDHEAFCPWDCTTIYYNCRSIQAEHLPFGCT